MNEVSKRLVKKILKAILGTLSGVLTFLYILIALLNTTIVQSFTAAKVADFFSKEWNTKVSIGALNVSPFITAGIKDIYVEDLQKDTLCYVSYVEANLKSIETFKHIIIRNAKLENVVFNMDITEKGTNFQFIIDYFKGEKKEKKEEKKEPFVLEIEDICLSNINFRMRNLKNKAEVKEGLFASNLIHVKNMNLLAKDFMLKGGDITLDVKDLSLKERCGINLVKLSGKLKASGKNIYIKEGRIVTDNTSVVMNVDLKTDSYKTYGSFMDSVLFKLDIANGSFVGMKDISYFSKQLRGAEQRIYITTDLEGLANNLKITNLEVKANNTHLQTFGSIKGLPNIKDTYFNLALADVSTSYKDIVSQKFGAMNEKLKSLPSMIERLGDMTVRGDFEGKINDFTTDLDITTNLGSVDLKAMATPEGNNGTRYKADVQSSGVNVGTLINNSMLGNTSLLANADIVLSDKNKSGVLKANVKNFYFKGNSYDEIDLNATLNNYDIEADLNIIDDYANVQALCNLNYEGKPTIDLDAKVSQLDLHRLHLYSFSDTNTVISLDLNADIQNLDINNLNGNVDIKHINVINTNNDISLDGISVKMTTTEEANNISVVSDILDAEFKGKYTVESLQEDFDYIINKYIPDFSVISAQEGSVGNKKTFKEDYAIASNLNFDIKVKDLTLLRELFDVDVNIADNLSIDGRLNDKDILYAEMRLPFVQYADKKLDNGFVVISTTSKELSLTANANNLSITDSIAIKDLGLAVNSQNKNVDLLARFTDANNDSTQGRVELNSYFSEKGIQANFTDTYFDIMGKHISFNNNHILGMLKGDISIMNLGIRVDNSELTLDGMISDDGLLTCSFSNLDLSIANMFLEDKNIKLGGVMNKDVVLKNVKKGLVFTSNLELDDFSVNDIPIGKAWLNVDNAIASDVFNANIKFLHETEDKQYVPLQLIGTIAPQSKEEQMNLSIDMDKFDLAIANSFVSSFASDMEGVLSCKDFKVRGMFSSPEVQGTLHLNKAAMRVNMLGTKYYFTDSIKVDRNKLSFNKFTLRDAQKNKITIDGNVAHNDFSTFDIELKAVADKIKILDTKESSDQMYYGTAYASATVLIKGDSTMIDITGTARTEPGTSLTVPVTSKESIEESNFIVFTSQEDTTLSNTTTEKIANEKSLAYNISLDLNVNPNAKLYLPIDFNQVKGDLAAAGDGDLKIEMNSSGKFSMIGTVAIDNGKFKFNMMDIMEKTFDIEQGGTLTWNGEPAGGVLDLTAIYKTKTSLASILGETYSKPVDVESIIHITGQMTNPQPSFDIQLPNVDEQTREQVFMNIDRSDEKVMLEQTASILLTNQFYLSQGGYQTNALQSGVTSSVMGMAFSQLSGMLTNMVRFVDVGLNYTTGDETYSGQMDVNVGKSFGKWDLSVNASLGGDQTTTKTSDATNIIGDMSAKYKYTENLQFEVFNHSNANDFTKYNISPYTQGAKVIYKRDYNSIKDIFKRKKKK